MKRPPIAWFTCSKLLTAVAPAFVVSFGALAASACATPEQRHDPVSMSASPESSDQPRPPSTLSATLGSVDAENAVAESAAPTPTPDERKRVTEEYKALALKNDCRQGFPKLEGTWRFVGESKTPNYSDSFVYKGTRFKETLSGNPDGKYVSAEIEGEMRCVFKNRILVQLDKVKPEGAFGNHSGDSYPCDLLSDMDPKVDRMLMICYFDWDLRTAAGLEFEYERVVP